MAILLKIYVLLLTMLLVISVIDSQTTLPSQQTSVTEVTTQSAQQPEDPAPTESEIEKNTGLNFCFDFFYYYLGRTKQSGFNSHFWSANLSHLMKN